MSTIGLKRSELPELIAWADDVREEANGWAERAEAARRMPDELRVALDAMAAAARRAEAIAEAIGR